MGEDVEKMTDIGILSRLASMRGSTTKGLGGSKFLIVLAFDDARGAMVGGVASDSGGGVGDVGKRSSSTAGESERSELLIFDVGSGANDGPKGVAGCMAVGCSIGGADNERQYRRPRECAVFASSIGLHGEERREVPPERVPVGTGTEAADGDGVGNSS